MKKILLALTLLLVLFPIQSFAITATWNATTTASPITPDKISGNYPDIRIPFLTATSTTATSTFNFDIKLLGNLLLNTSGQPELFSTYKPANSDGESIWIGGGGQKDLGVATDTTRGAYNTSIGDDSLLNNTTGAWNTAIGGESGKWNTGGQTNTFLGYRAGLNSAAFLDQAKFDIITDQGMTMVGYGARKNNISQLINSGCLGLNCEVLQSNQWVFGNTAVTTNLFHGAVGIATNTPSFPLTVVGRGFFTSTTTAPCFNNTENGPCITSGSGSSANIGVGSTGQISYYATTSTTTLTATSAIFIQSNGNVGIGTTTSSAGLAVINGTAPVSITAGGQPNPVIESTGSGIPSFRMFKPGVSDWRFEAGRSAAGDFDISNCANSCERAITVTPSDQVGIGVNVVPSSALSVWGNGNRSFDWGDTSGIGGLSFSPGGNPVVASIGSTPLWFSVNNQLSAPSMVIQPNGNVGIGTTSPQQALTVNGQFMASSSNSYGGTGGFVAKFNDGTRDVFQITSDTPNNKTVLRLGNTGSWGIIGAGYDWFDPNENLARLDLNAGTIFLNGGVVPQGDIQFSRRGDAASTATQKSSYYSTYEDSLWNGSNDVRLYASTGQRASTVLNLDSFYFINMQDSAGTPHEWMTINNNTGNTGIGTTTPDSKLDINGNVRFEGNSSVTTAAIGGAIVSGGCDSTTTSVDATVGTTTAFITTPQADPSVTLGGTWAYSFLSAPGVITTRVCSNVTVTPNSVKYTVKIIK